jgi:hypothetical protein
MEEMDQPKTCHESLRASEKTKRRKARQMLETERYLEYARKAVGVHQQYLKNLLYTT